MPFLCRQNELNLNIWSLKGIIFILKHAIDWCNSICCIISHVVSILWRCTLCHMTGLITFVEISDLEVSKSIDIQNLLKGFSFVEFFLVRNSPRKSKGLSKRMQERWENLSTVRAWYEGGVEMKRFDIYGLHRFRKLPKQGNFLKR